MHDACFMYLWTLWLRLRTGTCSILADTYCGHYWPDERHPIEIAPVVQQLDTFEDRKRSSSLFRGQANDEPLCLLSAFPLLLDLLCITSKCHR